MRPRGPVEIGVCAVKSKQPFGRRPKTKCTLKGSFGSRAHSRKTPRFRNISLGPVVR